MRDPLNTPRTRRYAIGGILTGKRGRTVADVDTVGAFIVAGSLTPVVGELFGLFDSPAFDDSCSITSGLKVLTSPNNPWTEADVGKAIDVQGAGAASATLRTTIASYSNPGLVVLTDAAGTTVAASRTSASGLAIWGNALNLTSRIAPQSDYGPGAATGETRSVALAGNLDAGANQITNLGVPASANEAATKAYVDAAIAALGTIHTGDIVWRAIGGAPPAGWLVCDGSLCNPFVFSALFALIGNTYGGDGVNNFAVPDLRGRTAIGTGTGSGLTPRVLADSGGEETHVLTVPEIPAHHHSYNNIGATPSSTGFGNSGGAATTGDTGGDGAHNNMQPFLALTALIKT